MNKLMSQVSRVFQTWGSAAISSYNFNSMSLNADQILDENSLVKHEKYVNEVKLMGRIGADPTIEKKNGKDYAKFSLATNFAYKPIDSTEKKVKTEWHNIITYEPNQINYIASFLKKGQRVYISGRLSYITSDKNPNLKIAFITLNDVVFLSS